MTATLFLVRVRQKCSKRGVVGLWVLDWRPVTQLCGYHLHMSDQILYLDYDGVLNPGDVCLDDAYVRCGHQLFEQAKMLAVLLSPYPSVRIVLSTDWVETSGFSHATGYLPPVLRERVIALLSYPVARVDIEPLSKGQQVLADVCHRRPKSWVAINGGEEGLQDFRLPNLLNSNPAKGLACHRTRAELLVKLDEHFGRFAEDYSMSHSQYAALARLVRRGKLHDELLVLSQGH